MPPRKIITVNPTFKWAVIINCIICAATLVVMVLLAFFAGHQSAFAERLFVSCEKVFLLTAGAFVGLLAGRAASPDPRAE